MSIMCTLALWAYVMAAFTNPGHADPKQLTKYRKKDLNQKLLDMLATVPELSSRKSMVNDELGEGGSMTNPIIDGDKDIN